jgi:uncharacterized protein (TIGR02466 family)
VLVHNLFPTPVAKFFIGRDFTAEELAFVEQQPTHNNMGNTTSDDRYVLTHKTMSDIYAFTQNCVDKYLANIHAPRNKVSLRVTQSWFNYSKHGEWHHKHSHANSFVSGVLYMKAVKDTDKITFHKEEHKWFEFPTDKFNEYNSPSWWLPVETGQLMLFPSSLAHSVPQVEANETRISLAFNTFPVGYVGQEETLTALHLGNENPKITS